MLVTTLCHVDGDRHVLPPLLQAAAGGGPDSPQQRGLLSLMCSCLKLTSLPDSLTIPRGIMIMTSFPVSTAISAGRVVMQDMLARPASPPGRASTTAAQLMVAWLQLFGRGCLLSAQQMQVVVDAVKPQQAGGDTSGLRSGAGSAAQQLWVQARDLAETYGDMIHLALADICSTGGLLPWLPPVLQHTVSSTAHQALALQGCRMVLPVGGSQFTMSGRQIDDAEAELTWRANAASEQTRIDGARALGSLLCSLPRARFCSYSSCANMAGPSEAGLVKGGNTVCSGCRAARYCSRRCQAADWKAAHKGVCKALQQAAAAQQQQQEEQDEAAAA